jgi:Tfp pilus assembly protein PilZ
MEKSNLKKSANCTNLKKKMEGVDIATCTREELVRIANQTYGFGDEVAILQSRYDKEEEIEYGKLVAWIDDCTSKAKLFRTKKVFYCTTEDDFCPVLRIKEYAENKHGAHIDAYNGRDMIDKKGRRMILLKLEC